ncbi:MAG: Lrp/AsnC family transcriptional regulator [Chloroflexi bacterium]|nr:Lrp/AsnC family transcriptional regulator [Chloroflexota bacterium]
MDVLERRLILLLQEGIPLVTRPYEELAQQLGSSEEDVLQLTRQLLAEGKIKRLGAVPNHYALGITANGMTVWDVPDDQISAIGHRLGQYPEVTHCYRRPRHLPHWPYNLFAMIHSYSREEVLATMERIAKELKLTQFPHEVIFSTRLLKKTGIRLKEKTAPT